MENTMVNILVIVVLYERIIHSFENSIYVLSIAW